jgi:TRAP-type C4-dicarboxylate transport system permease small subunit
MQPVLSAVNALDRLLEWVCRGLIVATMAGLLLVIGANVVTRYVLEQGGVNAVGEIPELLFPWMIAAGIIMAVQRGAHIAVDLLLLRLGERGRGVMLVFINLVVIAGYAILIGPVLQVAEISAIEHTPLLGVPRSIGFYSLAFAMTGVIIAAAAITLRVLLGGAGAAPQFDPEESVT